MYERCNRDSHITIHGYTVLRKERTHNSHGGVCLYLANNTQLNRLWELENPRFEIIWVNDEMLEYLNALLMVAEGMFPGCGIIIAGDFNKLEVKTFLPPLLLPRCGVRYEEADAEQR